MVAVVAVMTFAGASSASAEERYTDEDAGYIKVAARIVQPVGILLENVIFKPFTAMLAWSDPPPLKHEIQVLHPRDCFSSRPHRGCSSNTRW